MSEEVDLVVVEDHVRAEEICEALKHAGIHHVDFWPEDILDPSIGIPGHGVMEPVFRVRAQEPQGPFHIRVREEDLAQAQLVLSRSGLQGS
jgi:hypothetical protein